MNSLHLAIVFVLGAAIGLLYFGGLWLTVDRLISSQRPMMLYLGSFAFRLSIVVVCGMLALQIGVSYLISATFGFFVARLVMVSRSSTTEPNRKAIPSAREGAG